MAKSWEIQNSVIATFPCQLCNFDPKTGSKRNEAIILSQLSGPDGSASIQIRSVCLSTPIPCSNLLEPKVQEDRRYLLCYVLGKEGQKGEHNMTISDSTLPIFICTAELVSQALYRENNGREIPVPKSLQMQDLTRHRTGGKERSTQRPASHCLVWAVLCKARNPSPASLAK